jgi:hypothetical protein
MIGGCRERGITTRGETMKYWCEIRTQGINDAMSRVTGSVNMVHRGIFEGANLLAFFQKFAALNPSRPSGQDLGSPPVATISGPNGTFKVRPLGGALLFDGAEEKVSALTATIVVAGLLSNEIFAAAA